MTSKLRRLKKFCSNRYPAVSGKGWWHHLVIFETPIVTKLFQQSPLAYCTTLQFFAKTWKYIYVWILVIVQLSLCLCICLWKRGDRSVWENCKDAARDCKSITKRKKRERGRERDTKRTVNVILLTKLPDVQSRRHRSDQLKPCSIGSSLCLIGAFL